MSSKLNWMLQNTTSGSIVLQSWLTKNGISPQLAAKYQQSSWLHKIANGVYVRVGRSAGWPDAVSAVSTQLSIPMALAGITSLSYQGKSHYLQLNQDSVWVSVSNKSSLPVWFKSFCVLDDQHLKSKETSWRIVTHKSLIELKESDFITLDVKGVEILASSQELAAFEMLEQVPKEYSFEYAAELMQGLVNLSPRKVQSLLERSTSIRTNRLYLFFGHYYQQPWFKRIQEESIPLGVGNRQIVKGGSFNKHYKITVPKAFSEDNQESKDRHGQKFSLLQTS
jgi:hypothetical protein